MTPPQIAQLATCLAPSLLIGGSLPRPRIPPRTWPGPLRSGSPPDPNGSHPIQLIGESAGTCFQIGLFSEVPVPATPTEQHPLLQSAGTPFLLSHNWRAQPQFQHREYKMLPPSYPGTTTTPPHPHPLSLPEPRSPCPLTLHLDLEHRGGTLNLSRAPTKFRDP